MSKFIYCGKINTETNKIEMKKIKIIGDTEKSFMIEGSHSKGIHKRKIGTVVKTTGESWAMSETEAIMGLYNFYRSEMKDLKERMEEIKTKGKLAKSKLEKMGAISKSEG